MQTFLFVAPSFILTHYLFQECQAYLVLFRMSLLNTSLKDDGLGKPGKQFMISRSYIWGFKSMPEIRLRQEVIAHRLFKICLQRGSDLNGPEIVEIDVFRSELILHKLLN